MKKNTVFLFLAAILMSCASLSAQTLKEAIRLTENEQYDLATSIYQVLVMGQPSNGTYFYYFGENLLLSDEVDTARIVFNRNSMSDSKKYLRLILESGSRDSADLCIAV